MSEVVDEVIIEEPVTPRLKTMYKEEILPELEKEFHHDNPMQIHRPEAEDHQGEEVRRTVPPARRPGHRRIRHPAR